MKVQALVSFTYKDNVLSMYAGEIADVDSTIGADLISEGYVKEYSEGGDDGLEELEYTVSVDYITLTKTPAEIKALIDAGKGLKIICNEDLASAISANEGDVYIAFQYSLYQSALQNLDFARASAPVFVQSDPWVSLPFSVEESGMLQVILF